MDVSKSVGPRFKACARLATLAICFASVLLLASGCGLLMRPGDPAHTGSIGSVQFTTNQMTKNISLVVLQGQVTRFADEYASTVAQASDDYAAAANTPEARLRALKWKLSQATAAFVDATGPSPALNSLDLLVLASLSRMVVEDHWTEHGVSTNAIPLLEAHRKLEANIWAVVNGVLKPEQQREVKDLIQEWRQKNPDMRYVGAIRFQEFVVALGKSMQQKIAKPNSVLGLLALDPLAGLDPTALAIEETRRTAERMMYYTQRMPFLLTWQVEILAYQLADQPESQQIIGDVNRLATAAESFAKTADKIPGLVSSEREAAIRQVFEEMRSQGADAVGVLKETRQTLDASSQAAASINSAIQSLDSFVRYVSPTNTTSTSTDTNSPSFNVLNYGQAAAQIGGAAKDINAMLSSLNDSAAQVAQIRQDASANAERLLHRAFWLGMLLISVLLAGSVVAGLVYRAISSKFFGAQKNNHRD
jgi:hypothetical protein